MPPHGANKTKLAPGKSERLESWWPSKDNSKDGENREPRAKIRKEEDAKASLRRHGHSAVVLIKDRSCALNLDDLAQEFC